MRAPHTIPKQCMIVWTLAMMDDDGNVHDAR